MIEAIDRARRQHCFDLWAWVIMPEHVHLLIMPRRVEYSVSAMLKSIKQPVARRATAWLRSHHPDLHESLRVERPSGKVEHRFWEQGGGYDRNLWSADAIWSSIDYIHDNPVRRRLVRRGIDWKWSSARWYDGQREGLEVDSTVPPLIVHSGNRLRGRR